MVREIYRNPNSYEVFGHSSNCQFVNMQGPTCVCDPNPAINTIRAMTMMGWKLDKRSGEGRSYLRCFGKHIILVSCLIDGWQIRWELGPGGTLMEKRGFATIGHLMTWFWGDGAERFEEMMKTSWEHAAMRNQLKGAGIEPRELGKKPKPMEPAVKSTLKHEVTNIMDQKGRE